MLEVKKEYSKIIMHSNNSYINTNTADSRTKKNAIGQDYYLNLP